MRGRCPVIAEERARLKDEGPTFWQIQARHAVLGTSWRSNLFRCAEAPTVTLAVPDDGWEFDVVKIHLPGMSRK
jgi:hypothetical protein